MIKKPLWLQGKNARIAVLGIVSLAIGLVAAFASSRHLEEQLAIQQSRMNPKVATVEVVVAKHDLARGAVITAEQMAVRAVPKDVVGERVILPASFEQVVGAKLAQPVKAGEPLQAYALEGREIATFASRVKSGIRAVTIGVDDISSVSGMIQPGDQIDLLWSVKPSSIAQADPTTLEKTVVFMQGLNVLATGKNLRPVVDDDRNRGYSSLTVEASPAQAQRLVVAQRTGKLTAVLRNPQDQVPLSTAAIDLAKLLDLQRPSPQARASTEIIVGGRGSLKKEHETLSQ
jgi:pilus assembly protein CpaB